MLILRPKPNVYIIANWQIKILSVKHHQNCHFLSMDISTRYFVFDFSSDYFNFSHKKDTFVCFTYLKKQLYLADFVIWVNVANFNSLQNEDFLLLHNFCIYCVFLNFSQKQEGRRGIIGRLEGKGGARGSIFQIDFLKITRS